MKGQFARRAMELGGAITIVTATNDGSGVPDKVKCDTPATRLVQVMRKIDPDLAHMIESLAPAYLVKK